MLKVSSLVFLLGMVVAEFRGNIPGAVACFIASAALWFVSGKIKPVLTITKKGE